MATLDDWENKLKPQMAEIDLITGLEHFSFRANCRNTQHIPRAVLPFYRSAVTPVSRGPQGRPSEVLLYASEQALKQHLRQTLHRLVVEESVSTGDIVILIPRSRENSWLWRWGSLGNFRLTDRWPPGSGEVYCTSVYQFKGLESPVVILAEIHPSAQQDMEAVLYVGCSRARNHLIVLADQGSQKDILARLASARSAQ